MNNTKKLQYRVSEQFYKELKEYQKVTHKKLSPLIRHYLKELVKEGIDSNEIEV